MKLLVRITLLLSICVVTGCATIFSGSAPQAVSIMTEPEGVNIAIINMRSTDTILKIQSPYTAMLERKDDSFQPASYLVMLTKPGYIEEDVEIRSNTSGWVWGNVLFGGVLGVLIDGGTGAMFSLDNAPIKVKLYPDTVEGRLLLSKGNEDKRRRHAEEEIRENDKKSIYGVIRSLNQ
jgi:hypothetical protein